MRKQVLFLAGLLLLLAPSQSPPALAAKIAPPPGLHVVGAEVTSPDVASLLEAVNGLVDASNHHDLEGVLKHYSPRFVSGDNLKLEEVQHLIEETWKTYPDIRYDTKVMEIRVNGDWATVESMDSAKAVAKSDSVVSETPGQLESHSRGLLFLRRMGKTWEVLSDYTIYESATILYGDAKNLKVVLSAPDQVFASEPYTAKVDVEMPAGSFAIATISKDPVVYPQLHAQDKFRSLSDQQDSLERVFQANDTNNNEMITATIGLTQIGQDDQERPTVKLNGIATVVKRVNVIPKSKYVEAQTANQLVKQSANGAIDLSKNPSSTPQDGSPTLLPGNDNIPDEEENLNEGEPSKDGGALPVSPAPQKKP